MENVLMPMVLTLLPRCFQGCSCGEMSGGQAGQFNTSTLFDLRKFIVLVCVILLNNDGMFCV